MFQTGTPCIVRGKNLTLGTQTWVRTCCSFSLLLNIFDVYRKLHCKILMYIRVENTTSHYFVSLCCLLSLPELFPFNISISDNNCIFNALVKSIYKNTYPFSCQQTCVAYTTICVLQQKEHSQSALGTEPLGRLKTALSSSPRRSEWGWDIKFYHSSWLFLNYSFWGCNLRTTFLSPLILFPFTPRDVPGVKSTYCL